MKDPIFTKTDIAIFYIIIIALNILTLGWFSHKYISKFLFGEKSFNWGALKGL